MKILTITCHNVYNYGASLQAYALQSYLKELGHETEIIDFTPNYQNVKFNFWYIPSDSKYNQLFKLIPLFKFFYCLIKNTKKFLFWGRKVSFDNFTSQYLTLTNYHYQTSKELQINYPNADMYIAGSDQIWNTFVANGIEPAYYLDFGHIKTKRISYAASFGSDKLKEDTLSFVKSNLSRFNQISIRESSGVRLCNNLGFKCYKVVDPVFLLKDNQWNLLAEKARDYPELHKKQYILVYDFIKDSDIKKFALKSKEKLKLPIVSVNDYLKIDYADYNINDAGPLEFLNLIKNASIIICNSFHALAFSVIFNKEFYVFSLSGFNNSSRMYDFLRDIGCIKRYNPDDLNSQNIDYHNISCRLDKMISSSKDFLILNTQ